MFEIVKKNKLFSLSLIIVGVLAVLPMAMILVKAGGAWRGIVPEYIDDSLYYFARMTDFARGHLFIGNPYFLEHQFELAPAFFVADWLAAIPLLLGLTLTWTIILNNLVWQLIAFSLLCWLFRELELPLGRSLVVTWVTYFLSYQMISRPVSMQTIYPFVILFFVAICRFLKNSNRLNGILLTAAFAASFYLYTYFWQITLATMFLALCLLLLRKKWSLAKQWLMIILISLVLALPVFAYTGAQLTNPYYWESMGRIGLVSTHLPTSYAAFSAVIVALCLTHLLLERPKKASSAYWIFLLSTGGGLIVACLSNIITGKELEIGIHLARFVVIWLVIYLAFIFNLGLERHRVGKFLLSLIILLALYYFYPFVGYFFQPFQSIDLINVAELQKVAGPLNWIRQNSKEASVVWTDNRLSYFVPVIAGRHVLFSPVGELQLVPSKEIEERYLVANYFNNLKLAEIERDYRLYAGAGNAVHQAMTHNRGVKLCQLAQLNHFGYNCGQLMNPIDWRGQAYFTDLEQLSLRQIKPHLAEELAKFRVNYILIDTQTDKFDPAKVPNYTPVYADDRYVVYGQTS